MEKTTKIVTKEQFNRMVREIVAGLRLFASGRRANLADPDNLERVIEVVTKDMNYEFNGWKEV